MAIELSVTANAYLQGQAIEPNIILEIEGFPFVFGAQAVFETVKIGGFVIGDGSKIGGTQRLEKSKDWIMLNGTTNNISQQVNIDRAEGSSITSFKISLIDKNGELTRLLSPSVLVQDPLGLEARIYWMPAQAAFPRDAATLFIGVIDTLSLKQGSVVINVAHPDQLKRQDILAKATAKLTVDLLIAGTTANVASTAGFTPSQAGLKSFLRIGDEILEYATSSSTEFLTLIRGALGSVAEAHEIDDEVESFYTLEGRPFSLALQILLSGGEAIFATKKATRFVSMDAATLIPNAIFFEEFDVMENLGLVQGDTVQITGATVLANNLTSTIIDSGRTSLGSYIVLASVLEVEVDSLSTCSFTSKYNLLNFGCGLKPYQVDVEQFEKLDNLVGSSHPDYLFYIKDTIKASDFLEKEIYFPVGIYSVPRKGRISCNVTTPPIASADTVVLNEDTTTNAAAISVERTINQRFYNAVVYKYNIDSVSDRFLSARITQSAVSTSRIKIGNKFLTIESNGLRDDQTTSNLLDVQARRFLDRYQFGAEKLSIETTFKAGFKVEVGDTVLLEGASLGISDSKSGSRDFAPRVMEVTNKSINLKSGMVKLEVTDTGYSTNARYSTWAPSSLIDGGSTTTSIKLKRSFSTKELAAESRKWSDYINQTVIVRTEDWSSVQETRIIEIVQTSQVEIIVSPPITAPFQNYILDVPQYDQSSTFKMRLYKTLHASWCKIDVLIDVPSPKVLEVADGSIYKVNNEIRLRDELYTRSFDTTILSINGNFITIREEPIGGIPVNTLIDFIGFGDGGNYYAFF
jgi:hypothetical protein